MAVVLETVITSAFCYIELRIVLFWIPISNYNLHSVGVDFGFSSSRTAIVMTEHLKIEGEDKIIVRFAEEYDKANPQTIECWLACVILLGWFF